MTNRDLFTRAFAAGLAAADPVLHVADARPAPDVHMMREWHVLKSKGLVTSLQDELYRLGFYAGYYNGADELAVPMHYREAVRRGRAQQVEFDRA